MSIKIPNYTGAGIYAIVNITEFKAYVGKARNIKQRAFMHRYGIKNAKHPNSGINDDVRAGAEFDIWVLHKAQNTIQDWELSVLELLYMYAMKDKGFTLYNMQPKDLSLNGLRFHAIANIMYYSDIGRNIESAAREKHGVYTAHLKQRKPENRRNAM